MILISEQPTQLEEGHLKLGEQLPAALGATTAGVSARRLTGYGALLENTVAAHGGDLGAPAAQRRSQNGVHLVVQAPCAERREQ
jgi:hypothetical protein